MMKILSLFVFTLFCFLADLAGAANQHIGGVAISRAAFNPSLGEKLSLTYELTKPDKVTVLVFDADGGLARTLLNSVGQTVGIHEVIWDGRDEEGKVVPDEVYMFTVTTVAGAVYDPSTFSGGVVGDVTEAQFSQTGIVTYELPAPSRVLIRLGIHNGPMLKTLVDWKPRAAGRVTDYWDGYDEDHLLRMRDGKEFSSLITYVTLPDNSVITYGNNNETYRDYKLGRGKGRPKKAERPRQPDSTGGVLPAHLVPPAWARSPRVTMTFPGSDESKDSTMRVVRDAIDVRINVHPSDRDRLLSDQFEVIFFVDNVFFAEAERGYLPLNWHWELSQVPPGEHILTVNISSFKGQVGVASRKVRIDRPAGKSTSTEEALGSERQQVGGPAV
jgi:hypothetical protein